MRIVVAVLLLLCAGCAQKIVYREYFPPDELTRIERADGSVVGGTKIEASKDGVPNWSDSKSFNVSFFGL